MPPKINFFTLTEKKLLVPNVYELTYATKEPFWATAGQFVTFLLPAGWRSYSLLSWTETSITLCVEAISPERWGRGGSVQLCDANIGDTFRGIGPAGHFMTTARENGKMFLGTGTGLVPLYAMILDLLEYDFSAPIQLVYGHRTKADWYYIDALKELSQKYSNLTLRLFLSREDAEDCEKGYIQNGLTAEHITQYSEFYICGWPQMVDDVSSKLAELGVEAENIFSEKY